MNGVELRDARKAAGLTAKQVSRASGTALTNIAAYERGTKRPNAKTMHRILAAITAGSTSPIHRNDLVTTAGLAAGLRSALRSEWSRTDMIRLVKEHRSNSKFVIDDEKDRASFFAEPSTTGDARWDALVAANAENLSLRFDIDVPRWSRGHALPFLWFAGEREGMFAYALARTPASMQVRGVVIDAADLEAV